MSDLLVDLSQNPLFRQAIKQLGLPLPMPEKLRRPRGPWDERPLQDRNVVVFTAGGALRSVIAQTLAPAGATPHVVGETADLPAFQGPGEAFGRPPVHHTRDTAPPEGFRADALVFDGTGLRQPAELHALWEAFHPWIGTLGRSGRVIVLGRPAATLTSAAGAATQAGLEGFVRSLAKEVGRKGATAHAVFVPTDAESRLPGVLRFLLSDRSAFLSGQPWTLDARAAAPDSTPFVRPLEGRRALVTGAARGIGEAIAHSLAAEGAQVICLDRPGDESPLAQVAQAVKGVPLALDITDAEAPARLLAFLAQSGPLDVVIHNAGITRDRTLGRMSGEYWDQAVAVNLGAIVTLTNALLDAPRGLNQNARIVCLSSVSGLAGNVGQTNYSASKAGVVGYVRALATALGDRGITINAIAPGFIETRLTAAMPAVTREVARRLSALGQGGEPRDIAELCTFLASPGAAGLTGQCFRACGGMFIGA